MPLHTAGQLRLLGAEALAVASNMTDPNCRRIMISIAASYECLADHAEEREAAAAHNAVASLGGKAGK